MPTLAEAFALALKEFHTGNYSRAEQRCRQVLHADNTLANAWCFLGAACQAQGKLVDATRSYRQALRLKPDYVEAYYNLGLALFVQGQGDAAIAQLQQALACNPLYAEAIRELKRVLAEQENKARGLGNLPQNTLRLYGQAHYNLGVVAGREGHIDEAIGHYRQAVHLNPDMVEAHNNLANILHQKGNMDEAVLSYRQALRCKPDSAEVYNNLGAALTQLGQLEEAVVCYRQALRLNPHFAETSNNLGEALKELGHVDEALACFERALGLRPDFAESRWNRSLIWLVRGDFGRGWLEYEWRWTQPSMPPRALPQPLWDGSPLGGQTILLHAEQGLGDTLQFIRYVPLVKQRGGNVIVECQPQLLRLLTEMPGVERLVGRGSALPPFDVQAPLLSLPRIFHTSLATIPASVPYLEAAPDRAALWRGELEPLGGFKVGIAWQGSPTYRYDRQRSIPLVQFAPLAQVQDVHLISLQRGPGTNQMSALAGQFPVLDLADRLDATTGAFMDTAAVAKELDLVITSDTAVAHLAGALAVPVWLALPLVPDWRWLLERPDSPWYPSMRLFRQKRFGDWPDVFQRIAEELKTLVQSRHC